MGRKFVKGRYLLRIIYPKAYISPLATIDNGCVIMPYAIINTRCFIKKACIINCGAIVDYDCILEEDCHIAPGGKESNYLPKYIKVDLGKVIERSIYGKLKLLIIVGTRPEIIRLAAVIKKCRKYFDCLLAHTGQNYDYNLNGVFFHDLDLDDPDYYMNTVGKDLGETMSNIFASSYQLMTEIKPNAVLVLGDTNSCLSVIGAKRLHIPIFHMEAGNRCKDECLPKETDRRIVDVISDVNLAYSEQARRYLAECGLLKRENICNRISDG